jgi:hypothetical protein
VCDGCGHEFDIFAANGGCPQCRQRFAGTRCVDCGATFPLAAWAVPPVTRP